MRFLNTAPKQPNAANLLLPCLGMLLPSSQIVMITEQISYEEKRDLAKQLADKQVGRLG